MSNYDARYASNDYFYPQRLDEFDGGPVDYNFPISNLENEDNKQQYREYDITDSMNMNMKFIKDPQFNNNFKYNISSKSQPEMSSQSYIDPNIDTYYDQELQTGVQINQYNQNNQNSQNRHSPNHISSAKQNNNNQNNLKEVTPNHARNVPTQIQMDLHQAPHLHHSNPTISQLPDIPPHHLQVYPDQPQSHIQHPNLQHTTHPDTNARQSTPHASTYLPSSQPTQPHAYPRRPSHPHSLSQPLVTTLHALSPLAHTAPVQMQRKSKDYPKQSKKPKFHINLDNITNHNSKNFINKQQYRNGMTTTGDLAIPFMKNLIFSPASETGGFYTPQGLQDELLNLDDDFLTDLTPGMVPPKAGYFDGTTSMKAPTSPAHQTNMFFSPQIQYQEKTNNFSQNFGKYLNNKDDADISFNFEEVTPPSFKPIDENFDEGKAYNKNEDEYLAQPAVERSSSYQSVNSNSSTTSKDVPSSNSSTINLSKPKKKRNPKGAVCTICEKYISRDLTRHMRIHNDVGRFQCVYPKYMCNHKTQNFNRPYDYKKHLLHMHFKFDDPKGKTANTLTDKLPIHGSCLACGTRFIAQDWLKEHVLTHNVEVRCPFIEDRADRKEFDL